MIRWFRCVAVMLMVWCFAALCYVDISGIPLNKITIFMFSVVVVLFVIYSILLWKVLDQL